MPNELQIFGANVGVTMAARVRLKTNLNVYNASTLAFEAWSDANVANYRLAMTEAGGGAYQRDLPTLTGSTALADGEYLIEYEEVGVGVVSVERVAWFDSKVITPLSTHVDGFSQPQVDRLILAMLCGRITGVQTGVATVKDPAGAETRLTITSDANGNRSAVVATPA